MTKKIFRSFMLSAVAVLLAGVVIVMTCLYSYFASVQESHVKSSPDMTQYSWGEIMRESGILADAIWPWSWS